MTYTPEKLFTYARNLLLGLSVVPILYFEYFFYPYVTPKAFVVRLLVTGALALTLIALLRGGSLPFARLRSWYAWIPAALLLIAFLASFLGIDVYRSFWSTYDRADGLLGLLMMTTFFYLAVLLFDRSHVEKFFAYAGTVTGIVAIHAILQWVESATGMQIPLITDAEHGGRLGGTLGNAAFLAGYLAVGGFLALYTSYFKTGRLQKWYQASAVLALVGVMLSATRGSLLALLVALGLYLVFLVIEKKGFSRKVAGATLLGFVLFAALFVTYRDTLRHVPFEPVSRLASISTDDATTSSRLFVWKHMMLEAKESPLLGYGAENINVLYNRFFDPSQIGEEWFDRSHNSYIDYLVQYGIVGLCAYLGIMFLALRFVWLRYTERKDTGVLLALALIVYIVQAMFVFETVSIMILLMFLAAAFLVERTISSSRTTLPKSIAVRSLVWGSVGLVLVSLVPFVFFPALANAYLKRGYSYHVVDVSRALSYWERGYNLNTSSDIEYGYRLYETYLRQVDFNRDSPDIVSAKELEDAYRFSRDVLLENAERYPHDARTLIYLGHVVEARPPGVAFERDQYETYVRRAIELSPGRSQAWYMLANLHINEGDASESAETRREEYGKAIALVDEYSARIPELAQPYFIRANLLLTIGERARAEEMARRGTELYRGDIRDARRAAAFFLTTEDFISAERFLRDVVAGSKTDYVMQFDLAKVLFINGKREEAARLLATIERAAPEVLETDPAFMQAFRASM